MNIYVCQIFGGTNSLTYMHLHTEEHTYKNTNTPTICINITKSIQPLVVYSLYNKAIPNTYRQPHKGCGTKLELLEETPAQKTDFQI